MFVDDWIVQCKSFEEAQKVLEEDLKIVDYYFRSTRLLMNPNKTEVSHYHYHYRIPP